MHLSHCSRGTGSRRQTGPLDPGDTPDFYLESTGFFPGKHLIHFLVLKMKDFRNFVLDNLTLNKFT